MMKRPLDIFVAGIGLLILSPLWLVLAALVKMSSPGPVIFCHERMGRGFRPFKVYKFRTMVRDSAQLGGQITVARRPAHYQNRQAAA